jgi:hypothetical protein
LSLTSFQIHSLQIQHTYQCAICGAVDNTQVYAIAPGAEIPRPCPPSGWRYVIDPLLMVCPKHRIVADVFELDPNNKPVAWRLGIEL